jgi:hypothetical protein
MSVRHFADCSGVPATLTNVWYSDFKRDFARIIGREYIPGEKVLRDCQLFAHGLCALCGQHHPAQRFIRFAKTPSLHKCDARCMGATGPNCECSCGGKNHGRGFVESFPLMFDSNMTA